MMQAVFLISFFLFTTYALLIIYYAFSWYGIPLFSVNYTSENEGAIHLLHPIRRCKISIIIPARNEAANIKDCLDSICSNCYPRELFEVLVIDDHSTDDTAVIIKNYPVENVRLISLQEYTKSNTLNSYKKKAIEIAVQHASGELIITTDADCIAPPNWLKTIDVFYQQTGAVLIVMPVKFNQHNTFISIFQSLDFMTLQGITGASVYKKMHSMCNGANLAYTKKAFEEVGGFAGIDGIASGDDMLLMHKIFSRYPDKVCYLKSRDVIVQTQPAASLKDFINQRIRWASKADKYDDKRIFAVLLLVYLFNVWLLALAIASFFYSPLLSTILILLIAKTVVELFFLFPVADFFSSKLLLFYFPFAQPFHICYTVVAGWLGKFGTYQWKGRQVK